MLGRVVDALSPLETIKGGPVFQDDLNGRPQNQDIELVELAIWKTRRTRLVILITPSLALESGRRIEDVHRACHRRPQLFWGSD